MANRLWHRLMAGLLTYVSKQKSAGSTMVVDEPIAP